MGNLMDDLLENLMDEARLEALEEMFADLPYPHPYYEEMD
jgi:hypothetical protein